MERRIFVIEDDENVVEIVKLLFEEDFKVYIAPHGGIVESVIESMPDLILLDLRLHGSDRSGMDICSQLKRHPLTEDIPVILISAEYQLENLAEQCGAQGYLHKPFSIFELRNLVFQYLLP